MKSFIEKTPGKIKGILALILAWVFCLGVFFGSYLNPIIELRELTPVTESQEKLTGVSGDQFRAEFITYLDTMYAAAENENLLVDAFYWQLRDAEEKGISYEEGAKSNALKGFLIDLESSNLIIKNDILYGYVVTPDLETIFSRYKGRMDRPLTEYMEFRIYELNNHLFNINIETLDIPEIVKRLDIIAERLTEEDAGFHDFYFSLQNYYMDKLLGIDHDFFMDYGKTPAGLSDYAINQYAKLLARNDDIARHVKDLLDEDPAADK